MGDGITFDGVIILWVYFHTWTCFPLAIANIIMLAVFHDELWKTTFYPFSCYMIFIIGALLGLVCNWFYMTRIGEWEYSSDQCKKSKEDEWFLLLPI